MSTTGEETTTPLNADSISDSRLQEIITKINAALQLIEDGPDKRDLTNKAAAEITKLMQMYEIVLDVMVNEKIQQAELIVEEAKIQKDILLAETQLGLVTTFIESKALEIQKNNNQAVQNIQKTNQEGLTSIAPDVLTELRDRFKFAVVPKTPIIQITPAEVTYLEVKNGLNQVIMGEEEEEEEELSNDYLEVKDSLNKVIMNEGDDQQLGDMSPKIDISILLRKVPEKLTLDKEEEPNTEDEDTPKKPPKGPSFLAGIGKATLRNTSVNDSPGPKEKIIWEDPSINPIEPTPEDEEIPTLPDELLDQIPSEAVSYINAMTDLIQQCQEKIKKLNAKRGILSKNLTLDDMRKRYREIDDTMNLYKGKEKQGFKLGPLTTGRLQALEEEITTLSDAKLNHPEIVRVRKQWEGMELDNNMRSSEFITQTYITQIAPKWLLEERLPSLNPVLAFMKLRYYKDLKDPGITKDLRESVDSSIFSRISVSALDDVELRALIYNLPDKFRNAYSGVLAGGFRLELFSRILQLYQKTRSPNKHPIYNRVPTYPMIPEYNEASLNTALQYTTMASSLRMKLRGTKVVLR